MKLTFYKEIMQFVMICNNIFQKYGSPIDSVKVFSQKQIWSFGSRQSTGYDIRQQIILCF